MKPERPQSSLRPSDHCGQTMPLNNDTWWFEHELADIKPPPFLIDGVLPSRSVNMLFGEFNLGKTFLAIDWAASVASGRPWVGKQVEQGDVLYIASEGDPGNLGTRTAAWREHFHDERLPILFYTDVVDLVRDVHDLVEGAVARGIKPRLVIIDTLSMAMIDPENDNTAMNALIKSLRAMQVQVDADGEEFDIAWLLVHHTGWGDDKRPRGASAAVGGVDYIIGMIPGPVDGTVKVFNYKAKNSAKFNEMMFQQVPVGESLVYQYIHVEDAKKLERENSDAAGAIMERTFLSWLAKRPDDTTFGQIEFIRAEGLPEISKTTTIVGRGYGDLVERGILIKWIGEITDEDM